MIKKFFVLLSDLYKLFKWSIPYIAVGLSIFTILTSVPQIDKIEEGLSEVSQILEKLVPNVYKTWAVSNLTGDASNEYVQSFREVAAMHQTTFVTRDVELETMLTEEGKRILDETGLWKAIDSAVAENPGASLAKIMLLVGVDRLYDVGQSLNPQIDLDTMIGVAATLAHEFQSKSEE